MNSLALTQVWSLEFGVWSLEFGANSQNATSVRAKEKIN